MIKKKRKTFLDLTIETYGTRKEDHPRALTHVKSKYTLYSPDTSLETFEKVADGKATKIIIPSNLQNLAGMVSAFAELNEKSGTVGKE